MRPNALIVALCLLAGQTAAFVAVCPMSRSSPVLRMAVADDEKDSSTMTAEATPLEEVDEDGNVIKPASQSSKWALDERYEVKEDDSPLMKAGKALKPLNDVVETVTSSPLLTPVLILGPTLANPKIRQEIIDFFTGSQ